MLAFVERGEFKKDTVPSALIGWVNRTFENTEIVRKGLYNNKRAAAAAWRDYFSNNDISDDPISMMGPLPPAPGCQETSNTVTVGPLLTTTWGQGCTYNNMCPSKSCTNVCFGSPAAWTGCVATATAQVVRYWQPTTQYNYNYASMPTASGNSEVQRLMADLGRAENLNMNYGCNASGAVGDRAPTTLKARFGFTSGSYVNYEVSTYLTVKDNLNKRWPVLLDGCRTQVNKFLGIFYDYENCHFWVCDGYRATNYTYCYEDGSSGGASYLFFHMNWGWHETSLNNDHNGWFAFNDWNIPGINYNYKYANSAVINLHP